jgi:DNA primase
LTDEQAAQLATVGRDPIVATDADLAGQVAAERGFWMLTPHGLDPGYARFPDGLDPADLLAQRGPAALTAAVASGQPAFRSLGDQLLTERLDNLAREQARVAAMRILSARPSRAWEPGVNQVRARLQLSQMQARRDLRDAVKSWDADPRKAALAELHKSSEVRARLSAAAEKSPAERWAPLARELDPRLLEQGDWPATAAMLHEAHEQGHDVDAATRGLVAEKPLGDSPARDLRYRIVSRLELPIDTGEGIPAPTRSQGAARDRQDVNGPRPPRRGTPRR